MDESTNTTTKPKRNGKKTDRMQQYNLEQMSKKQRIKSPTAKDKNNPPSNSIESHFQKQTKQTSNNKSDGDGDDGDNNNNKSASHTKARNDIIAKAKYVKSTPFEERLKACIAPANLIARGKGICDYKKKIYSRPLLRQHLTESEYSDVVNYKNPDSSDEDSEDDKEEDLLLAKTVADMDKELISIDDNSEGTSGSDDDASRSDDDIEDKKPAATMEIEMGAGVTKAKTIVLPPGSTKKKGKFLSVIYYMLDITLFVPNRFTYNI